MVLTMIKVVGIDVFSMFFFITHATHLLPSSLIILSCSNVRFHLTFNYSFYGLFIFLCFFLFIFFSLKFASTLTYFYFCLSVKTKTKDSRVQKTSLNLHTIMPIWLTCQRVLCIFPIEERRGKDKEIRSPWKRKVIRTARTEDLTREIFESFQFLADLNMHVGLVELGKYEKKKEVLYLIFQKEER
jgi:hypothetical protein